MHRKTIEFEKTIKVMRKTIRSNEYAEEKILGSKRNIKNKIKQFFTCLPFLKKEN